MSGNQTGMLMSGLAKSVAESIQAEQQSSKRLRENLMAQSLMEQSGAERHGPRFQEVLASQKRVSPAPNENDNPRPKAQANPPQNKAEQAQNNQSPAGSEDKRQNSSEVATSGSSDDSSTVDGAEKEVAASDTAAPAAEVDNHSSSDTEGQHAEGDGSLQVLAVVADSDSEVTALTLSGQPASMLDENGDLDATANTETILAATPEDPSLVGEAPVDPLIASLVTTPAPAGITSLNPATAQNGVPSATDKKGIAGHPVTPFTGFAALGDVMDHKMANEPDFAPLEALKSESAAALRAGDTPSAASLSAQLLARAVTNQAAGEVSVSSDGNVATEAAKFKEALSSLQPLGARSASPAVNQYQLADNRSPMLQTGVQTAVGQPQWSRAVGERVLWLAAQNVNTAEIQLDPPELGPLQVRVSVNQDQASVTFTSQHPAVREALDQSAMRLREMFDSQGLNLVDVDVSDQSLAQQSQADADDEQAAGPGGADAEGEDAVEPEVRSVGAIGLVDQYA